MSRVALVAGTAVTEVVVVGAGIAGCTAAYELARQGFRVSLFDQRGIAPAASGRNMGLLLNDVEEQSVGMMRSALEVYRELEEGPVPFQLRQEPYLLVAQDEGQMRSIEQRALEMRRAGLSCDLLPEPAVRDGVPQLRAGVAGAFLLQGCWAVSAAAATRAFAEAARGAGARLRMGVRVAQLVVRSGRLAGILTDDGPISADAVVLAAGPWLPALLSGVPVSSGRGWLLRTGPLLGRLPWVVMEMAWPELDDLGRAARPPSLTEVAAGGYDMPVAAAVAMVPQPGGEALLGTSLAPSLLEPVEGVDMPERIARRALDLLPGFAGLGVTGGWYGLRPMTPDGLPLVGATPVEGLYLHAGHGSIGMQSAPWTARLLAGAMRGAPVPERLAPARFGDGWADLGGPRR
jgi:D-hydroxyproline dehydrogenase subunit beta